MQRIDLERLRRFFSLPTTHRLGMVCRAAASGPGCRNHPSTEDRPAIRPGCHAVFCPAVFLRRLQPPAARTSTLPTPNIAIEEGSGTHSTVMPLTIGALHLDIKCGVGGEKTVSRKDTGCRCVTGDRSGSPTTDAID